MLDERFWAEVAFRTVFCVAFALLLDAATGFEITWWYVGVFAVVSFLWTAMRDG